MAATGIYYCDTKDKQRPLPQRGLRLVGEYDDSFSNRTIRVYLLRVRSALIFKRDVAVEINYRQLVSGWRHEIRISNNDNKGAVKKAKSRLERLIGAKLIED